MKNEFQSASGFVDIRNDALMVELGIRPPLLQQRDPSIWTKTNQEKKLLKSLRYKSKMSTGIPPIKVIPIRAKLIIYLKKNKKFPYTTYSIICSMHQIDEYLRFFCQKDKSGNITNIVSKYVYNGKTYLPNERPFWRVV